MHDFALGAISAATGIVFIYAIILAFAVFDDGPQWRRGRIINACILGWCCIFIIIAVGALAQIG